MVSYTLTQMHTREGQRRGVGITQSPPACELILNAHCLQAVTQTNVWAVSKSSCF